MRKVALGVIVFYASFLSTGCAQFSEKPWAKIHDTRFQIEIANTEETRARGLMFRRELAPNAGMLFIFEDENTRSFWMENTFIPLDILYFDSQLRLVSAQLDVPPCGNAERCPLYPSAGPAKYVLELNAGQAERLQIKAGDALTLSENALKP